MEAQQFVLQGLAVSRKRLGVGAFFVGRQLLELMIFDELVDGLKLTVLFVEL